MAFGANARFLTLVLFYIRKIAIFFIEIKPIRTPLLLTILCMIARSFRPLPGSILFMSIAARFYQGIIDDFKKICFKIFGATV